MKTENIKKFERLVSQEDSGWVEKAIWRQKNKAWLDKSAAIAVKVLRDLRAKNMTQAELAIAMKVTPQQISKIVKGSENLTLETISKLESALMIKLIDIPR